MSTSDHRGRIRPAAADTGDESEGKTDARARTKKAVATAERLRRCLEGVAAPASAGDPGQVLAGLGCGDRLEPSDFEFRIFRYNSGLVWIYEQRVVTLVVLADLDASWRPTEYVFRLGEFESRLRFPTCKLIERLDNQWRDDYSLPVQIARAQIEALRTASDPEGRYRVKWQLVRNLYGQGYNADELREVFRLIDWMLALPEDLTREFEKDLVALEESLDMPYVTSVERVAEARGEARGAAAVLVEQLTRLCGPLSNDLRQRLEAQPLERLKELGRTLFDFQSVEDVQSWLDAREDAAPPAP